MTEYNYDEDVAIDPDNILEEWLQLSSKFWGYSRAIADVEKEVQQTWEKKKVIKALLIAESKEQGAKNDADREAYYRPHPDYQKATQDLIDIQHERDLITAARDSFYRKEKGLEGASVILMKTEMYMEGNKSLQVPSGKRMVSILKEEKATERRARRTR